MEIKVRDVKCFKSTFTKVEIKEGNTTIELFLNIDEMLEWVQEMEEATEELKKHIQNRQTR